MKEHYETLDNNLHGINTKTKGGRMQVYLVMRNTRLQDNPYESREDAEAYAD